MERADRALLIPKAAGIPITRPAPYSKCFLAAERDQRLNLLANRLDAAILLEYRGSSVVLWRSHCWSGIQFYIGRIGDIDPDMNMGRTAVVPHEGGTFQPPVVPHAVVTDVLIGKEGEVTSIQATLLL